MVCSGQESGDGQSLHIAATVLKEMKKVILESQRDGRMRECVTQSVTQCVCFAGRTRLEIDGELGTDYVEFRSALVWGRFLMALPKTATAIDSLSDASFQMPALPQQFHFLPFETPSWR